MKKKKEHLPTYKKESFTLRANVFHPDENMNNYVLEIFPDIRPGIFKNWIKENRKEKSFDIEPALFMTIVCGAYFRIYHPDVRKPLEELWKWLTHRMNNPMSHDLAELLIEAISPGIRKIVEARGYQQGWPKGQNVRKQGPPPHTRGAWVAGFVFEKYLQNEGVDKEKARLKAIELISVLLAREIEAYEFQRSYKKAPKRNIANLTIQLLKEYEFLIRNDAYLSIDPCPPEGQTSQYIKWRSRHKSLENVIFASGCETLCSNVISKISTDILESFWDIQVR